MKWNHVLMVFLALLVGILGTLVVTRSVGRGGERGIAWAQDSAQAGNIIGLIGQIHPTGRVPIVLIDGVQQTLIIYEYDVSNQMLRLQRVRSYRYDRQLVDFASKGSVPTTPSVREVQDYIDQTMRGIAPR